MQSVGELLLRVDNVSQEMWIQLLKKILLLLLLHKIVHVLTYLLQLCLSKFGSNQHSKLPGRPILSMLTKLLPVQFVSNLLVLYQLQHMSEA